jgi:hypothetical protein
MVGRAQGFCGSASQEEKFPIDGRINRMKYLSE